MSEDDKLSLAEAQALQSFGNRYYEFLLANKKLLDAMTDQELDCLSRAVEKTNTTNCWYASYQAAQLLKRQIRNQREWRRHVLASPSRTTRRSTHQPSSPVLRVDVVGDEAFLSIGTLDETHLTETFEQTAQVKVDVVSLIDALVAGLRDHARLHERRSGRG